MPGRFAERGFLIFLVLGLAAGCARRPVEKVETREAMNTVVTVRVVAPSNPIARRALDEAWKEMDECVRLLDCHRPDSHISQINQSEPPFTVFVHPLVANCLAAAKEVWEETGGAFDPTIGPLLELWRKAAEEGKEPEQRNIAEALERVGMDKVEIEMETMMVARNVTARTPQSALPSQENLLEPAHLVGFTREGMRLDLGGIAKGCIIGRMVRRMERAGATAVLVDAGGDVYAAGQRPPSLVPPGGDPRWLVGVQDPRAPAQSPHEPGRLFTRLHIGDLAVATSGHYYRGFTIAGKRYSHIIDPRTGRPVSTRLASVTVVSPDPAQADGLATAIEVLGAEEGMKLVVRTEGVECLLLEWAKEPPSSEPSDDRLLEAPLVEYRSKGFAALEVGSGPTHDCVPPTSRHAGAPPPP